MSEALFQMYDTMTETEQKEVYDFALFIMSKRNKQEKNPLEEFSGVLNNEDAAVMMSAIDDCRKVDQNEW